MLNRLSNRLFVSPFYSLVLAIVVITIIATFNNRYISVLVLIVGAVLWYDPSAIDGFLRLIKLKE
jgi:c-di-AMP phosphodiesterase-like protein